MEARSGCWTCKDRKVRCDRALPTCRACSRGRRVCQGYGLRLSWPAENDKKRAVTGSWPLITALPGSTGTAGNLFINTTWQDLETYQRLTLHNDNVPRVQLISSPRPSFWSQSQAGAQHIDLVNFFHDSAYLSLVTFSLSSGRIRDLLLRLALTNDTKSSKALLYALLAVSSLQRCGLNPAATRYKVASLHELSTSANNEPLGSAEAVQHVAACMLLCTFETSQPSDSSGEWLWYSQGAMDVIQSSSLAHKTDQEDVNNLVDWVYYHDTLSRFTMRHWRHKSVNLPPSQDSSDKSEDRSHERFARRPRPAALSEDPETAILGLLAEACDTLLDPRDPRSQDEDYKNHLATLEHRIRSIPTSLCLDAQPSANRSRGTIAVELYQISTLIYLIRSSESPWRQSAEMDDLVNKAFNLPPHEPPCNHFFPLFIIGCEARTDEQRSFVLNLIDKSEEDSSVRHMQWIRNGIQSVWVQKDLHSDEDLVLRYRRMVDFVISSNNTLPSYV